MTNKKIVLSLHLKKEKVSKVLLKGRKPKYINYNTKQRLKIVASLYATMLLQGNIDYWLLYTTAYNGKGKECILPTITKKQLSNRINKILSNNYLQQMLAEELKKILEENGFSIADAIMYRKQILLGAIAKKDFANANKALDSFDEKLGIANNKQEQPLLPANNNPVIFGHLSKVKEVNYKEIKQIRDSNNQQEAMN